MKHRWIAVANILLFLTVAGFGQTDKEPPKKGSGYFFLAPGALIGDGANGTLHFGGGGEGLLKGGFGVAGELGYLAPFESLGHGIGIFSPGVLYQFGPARKTVPFLTGGYTLAFRSGTANLIHFGGGVNHWFSERWGLRIEGRDHMDPSMPEYHFLQVRVGILIR